MPLNDQLQSSGRPTEASLRPEELVRPGLIASLSLSPLRITILQGAFLPVPPHLGGAVEKQWFALGKEFAARGHIVTHVSRSYPGLPSRETLSGVQHIRIRGADAQRSVLAQKAADLRYTLRATRVVPMSDIVVTNTFWAPFVFSLFHRGCVYVDFARMPKGQTALYPKRVRLRTPSHAAAELIKKDRAPGAADTRVIPNPISFQAGEVKLETKRRRILYAGRVHPEKGIHILLEAFLRLKSRGLAEDWDLDIVGPWREFEGGGGQRFMDELLFKSSHPSIHWHGPAHDPDILNRFYCEATIFCYPSVAERGETFGVAPLEAMAWGCAPVVSALECFNDFIQHGHNGLVFDHRKGDASNALAHQLATLIADPSLCERLATRALGVRETHSISRIASQFLEDFATCSR